MRGFRVWLEGVVNVGDEFEMTNAHGVRVRMQVRRVSAGKAWVAPWYYPDGQAGIEMPIASVTHFKNDLNQKVDIGDRKTGDPAVDAVLAGQGQFLAKGNDGVVFRVGDEVVKVSTTVPFIPENPGHRSPLDAARRLRHEYKVSEAMRKAGVPGILPGRFLVRGDKAFLVRPFIQVLDRLTPEQIAEVRASVRAMHRAGWAINDYIQVGLWQGHVYHYDLGAVTQGSPHGYENDNYLLSKVYTDSGLADQFAPIGPTLDRDWAGLVEDIEYWGSYSPKMRQVRLRKAMGLYRAMLEEHPERAAEIHDEFGRLMAKDREVGGG